MTDYALGLIVYIEIYTVHEIMGVYKVISTSIHMHLFVCVAVRIACPCPATEHSK